MPRYEYRCLDHGGFLASVRDDRCPCPICGAPGVRRFSFKTGRPFEPHYNHSLGVYVSSRQNMMAAARRLSENYAAEAGYEASWEAVDVRDFDGMGIDKAEHEHYVEETKRQETNGTAWANQRVAAIAERRAAKRELKKLASAPVADPVAVERVSEAVERAERATAVPT